MFSSASPCTLSTCLPCTHVLNNFCYTNTNMCLLKEKLEAQTLTKRLKTAQMCYLEGTTVGIWGCWPCLGSCLFSLPAFSSSKAKSKSRLLSGCPHSHHNASIQQGLSSCVLNKWMDKQRKAQMDEWTEGGGKNVLLPKRSPSRGTKKRRGGVSPQSHL